MKKIRNESGMVIVEATIVFPVMFLVIFLMIFAGNAYLQKCRVEAIVNDVALEGAAYCADPMIDSIKQGNIPALEGLNVYPYRYFDTNGVENIEDDIQSKLESKMGTMSSGLFSSMRPSNRLITAKYNNGFIYSTFSVDVEYKIQIPVKLLGASDYIHLSVFSHSDVPVSDSSEFIRNIDMVDDYMEKYGVKEKIDEAKQKLSDAIGKAKEWFNK